MPTIMLPVTLAATTEPNAPTSIMPSMPIFTTPDRSLNMPLCAANAIGVARTKLLTNIPVKFIDLSRVAQMRKAKMAAPATNKRAKFARWNPLTACQIPANATVVPRR
jgi:hypothetical protein